MACMKIRSVACLQKYMRISLQAVEVAGHFLKTSCWDYIPSPENSKPPFLVSGGFSAARPADAYAFRDGCDDRDDVFKNAAALVLAVTAVTVVTLAEKSL